MSFTISLDSGVNMMHIVIITRARRLADLLSKRNEMMVIHFDTRALAGEHLAKNGWREIKNGRFVSKDGTCAASIHPVLGSEAVAVAFNQIEAA